MRPRVIVTAVISGLLGIALLVVAMAGLTSARGSGDVRSDSVLGVPVHLYSAGPSSPTVVVAHGFAGSAQIMEPLAVGLRKAGFTVVTFDFPGHGTNPDLLPFSGDVRTATWESLTTPLAEVVDWASLQPEVDRGRMALLGHSMGAGAAVAYAVEDGTADGRIAATTVLSLPSADDVPTGEPAVPRDLLLLYGGWEVQPFADAALAAVQAAHPGAFTGVTYGDMADGTARRAEAVPLVEHIGILFSATTLDATVDWLSQALDHEPGETDKAPVLAYAALALVAGALLLVPVGLLALGTPPPSPGEPAPVPLRGRRVLAFSALTSIGGALVAWLLGPIESEVPVAVAGYLAAWFAGAGAVGLVWWLARIRQPRTGPQVTWRSILGSVVVAAVAVLVIVVPGRMSWSALALTGPRWWVLALLLVAFTLWFAVDELLVARASTMGRLGLAVASRVLAVAVLVTAIPVLNAPSFLLLILPVLLLLMVILAVYAAVIAPRRNSYVAAVLVQAVPSAVLVSTAFPLLG